MIIGTTKFISGWYYRRISYYEEVLSEKNSNLYNRFVRHYPARLFHPNKEQRVLFRTRAACRGSNGEHRFKYTENKRKTVEREGDSNVRNNVL